MKGTRRYPTPLSALAQSEEELIRRHEEAFWKVVKPEQQATISPLTPGDSF